MTDSQSAETPIRVNPHLDLYAAGVCSLCLLHCIAVPVLATMLPLAGLASEDELVHKILVLVAAPLTLWIVFKSFTVEGNLPFVIQALIGLGILLIAAFIEALAPMEVVLTIAGATLLAFAHVRRWMRYRQSAR